MVVELKKLEPATYSGPPARASRRKKRTIARAAASRNKNDRTAAFFCLVTSGSFLPARTADGVCEIGVRDNRFTAEDRIRPKGDNVLRAHHDPALGIHGEAAHRPSHRAGEA